MFIKKAPRVPLILVQRLKRIRRYISYFGIVSALAFCVLIISTLNFLPHNIRHTLNYLSYKFAGDPAHTVSNFIELREVVSKGITYPVAARKYSVPRLDLEIKQEDVLRLNHSLEDPSKNTEVKARLSIDTGDGVQARIRAKGDRTLHRADFENMSFRVNVTGDDTFRGMDKFSIQSPIIRNYTWEFLFASAAKRAGLLTLDMDLVELFVNGKSRGIYSIEEVPQKETIETNLRKNGPIFGLDEPLGVSFPDVFFEVYDKKYWTGPGLVIFQNALRKIDRLRDAGNEGDLKPEQFGQTFDTKKWAKFFALADLFAAYHGALLKSVKLYYNPVTGLIEPLVFDAHVGAGKYESFFLLDYILKPDNVDCYPACDDSEWFKLFFNPRNVAFISAYKEELELVSSDQYLSLLKEDYTQNLEPMTRLFYSRLMRSDAIFFEGLSLFHFDFSFLNRRADKIQNRLTSWFAADQTIFEGASSKASSLSTQPMVQEFENLVFKGLELDFTEPTIILLRGNNILSGLSVSERLTVRGPVMLVQLGGTLDLSNVSFIESENQNVTGMNWSGALNFIQTNVVLDNVSVAYNASEDAINSVSSNLTATNLKFSGALSDALDIDFGTFKIDRIICENIGNDCIDLSGASGEVNVLHGQNVLDKLISAGEGSDIEFGSVHSESVAIGVVSKDSSKVRINRIDFVDTELSGALFIKKPFFNQPTLDVGEIINNDEKGIFLVNDAKSFYSSTPDITILELSSSDIESEMYGNIYGVKTKR